MTPAKLVPAIHSIAIISLFRARLATGPISAQGLYSRKNLRKRMPFRNGPESGGKMAALVQFQRTLFGGMVCGIR
jgi:hypothetical protein